VATRRTRAAEITIRPLGAAGTAVRTVRSEATRRARAAESIRPVGCSRAVGKS